MLDLHKFMAATSRTEVNHDGHGGTAPDAMIWDNGSFIKPRNSFRVTVDLASLPGHPGFLDSPWCGSSLSPISQENVAVWPYIDNILLEFTSFLAALHWPLDAADIWKLGISCLELLIMFELGAGHRSTCEKVIRPHLRARTTLVGWFQFPGLHWE